MDALAAARSRESAVARSGEDAAFEIEFEVARRAAGVAVVVVALEGADSAGRDAGAGASAPNEFIGAREVAGEWVVPPFPLAEIAAGPEPETGDIAE